MNYLRMQFVGAKLNFSCSFSQYQTIGSVGETMIYGMPWVSKRLQQFLVSKAICEIVFVEKGGRVATSPGATHDPYLK